MDDKCDPDLLLVDLKSQTPDGMLTSTGYQVDETFCVKISTYTDLSGKGYEWNSFREDFEATVEIAVLGALLIYDPLDEEDHLEKLDYDPE